MGTIVTIHVVRPHADDAIERAFGWFREIERRCSRFDHQSELMQLTMSVGEAVTASPILFEAVRFALSVAEETGGAFDPTVGHRMEARGFNREDRTGRTVRTPVAPEDDISYRDVEVDVDAVHDQVAPAVAAGSWRRSQGTRRRRCCARTAAVHGLRNRRRRRSLSWWSQPAEGALVGRHSSSPNRPRADRFGARVGQGRVHVRGLRACRGVNPGATAARSPIEHVALRPNPNITSSIREPARLPAVSPASPSSVPTRCWLTRSRPPHSCSVRQRASGSSSVTASKGSS